MTRYYSPQEKSAALARLIQNGGSIALTAFQLRIPERTLREWRREAWLASQTPPPEPQSEQTAPSFPAAATAAATTPLPPPNLSQFEDDLEALNFMRRQIMDSLLSLSVKSPDNFAFMTPYQHGMMITHLIDRLVKLDQHLRPYTPQVQTIRVLRDDQIESDQLWIEIENTAYGPFSLSELDEKMDYYQGLGLDPRIVTHPSNNDDTYSPSTETNDAS